MTFPARHAGRPRTPRSRTDTAICQWLIQRVCACISSERAWTEGSQTSSCPQEALGCITPRRSPRSHPAPPGAGRATLICAPQASASRPRLRVLVLGTGPIPASSTARSRLLRQCFQSCVRPSGADRPVRWAPRPRRRLKATASWPTSRNGRSGVNVVIIAVGIDLVPLPSSAHRRPYFILRRLPRRNTAQVDPNLVHFANVSAAAPTRDPLTTTRRCCRHTQ